MGFFEDIAKGGAEGLGNAVKAAVSAFKADPTKVAELEAAILKATQEFQMSVIASVNATMQAEARSEHWAQWSWRPIVGFTFCATIINNYILYPYFAKFGMTHIDIPSELWMAMLAVLGVSAYVRGRDKDNNGGGK
jgi:hypothetical protein